MHIQQQCLPLPQSRRKRRNPSEATTDPDNEADLMAPLEIASLASMDAMEYLAFVKQQASSLPEIFVSKSIQEQADPDECRQINSNDFAPIDGSAAARDYLLSNRLEIRPPPSTTHVPPPSQFTAWKEGTLSNFSSLRVYLNACREELRNKLNPNEKITVPKSKDIYAWHVFCLGNQVRNEMEINMIHAAIDNLSHESSAVEIDLELEKYDIPNGGYTPSTQLMCQFDQIIIRRLLSHHTNYIVAGCGVTVKRMTWIYAILARLEKPLHRDEAGVLMQLLRELCRVRASVSLDDGGGNNDNEKIVEAMNVGILLIGAYFEQRTFLERLFVIPTLGT